MAPFKIVHTKYQAIWKKMKYELFLGNCLTVYQFNYIFVPFFIIIYDAFGCYQQWVLLLVFVLVCFDHYYGTDCNTPCGHCINNDVCDKGTGSCPNGCQNHWKGERCEGKYEIL